MLPTRVLCVAVECEPLAVDQNCVIYLGHFSISLPIAHDQYPAISYYAPNSGLSACVRLLFKGGLQCPTRVLCVAVECELGGRSELCYLFGHLQ
jgi:hypothetical protein